MKVLFILKYREVHDPVSNQVYSYGGLSSGLYNSARMVAEHLARDPHFSVHLVQVIDNNDIDREVTKFRPDVVVIEAFWVVPEKFAVLRKLHPHVKWVIRNHSNLPFLAQEGIAIRWTIDYVSQPNVFVGSNTHESLEGLISVAASTHGRTYHEMASKFVYFPNYYIEPCESTHRHLDGAVINIGCFGAIRPLKNHLVQAVAALNYAQRTGERLRFHINTARVESGGLPILHNLRAVFAKNPHAELVEHGWVRHKEFRHLISTMDVALQASISETFNIVTADAVTMGVPVVGSPDIKWLNPMFQANPLDVHDITDKIGRARRLGGLGTWLNRLGLKLYNKASGCAIKEALRYLNNGWTAHPHYYHREG